MIEIDRSKIEQFGINLFSQGKNQGNVTTGQFPSTQTYTPANRQYSGNAHYQQPS